jgi:hypothetical protein
MRGPMTRWRGWPPLRAASAVLAALLLAPLLVGPHAHPDAAKPASCAACVATQHSPGLAAVPVSCPHPALQALPLAGTSAAAPAAAVAHAHGGRGPPSLSPTRFA